MKEFFKVALAAAGGSMVATMIEPQLVNLFKPSTDFAKKAISAGAVGLGAGGIYWVIKGM